jgi:predicted dehydrogenase
VFSPLRPPAATSSTSCSPTSLLLLCSSFGPVASVKAQGQRLYGTWLDECQVEATFRNGLVAKVDASWSLPDYPTPAMVIECLGPDGRIIVSDDALEMDLDSLQGRVVAASEPGRLRYDSGDQAVVAEGFLRMLAGDVEAAEALSVAQAVEVAR